MESKVRRKLAISWTRKTLYMALFGSCVLPCLFVTCYAASLGLRSVWVVALFSSVLSGGVGGYLLRFWERKMQSSVNRILKEKLLKIHPSAQAQASAAPHVSAQPQKEIERLEAELAKTKVGYEHQMNLMRSSVAKSKEEVHHLNLEMDKKLEEMRIAYLEFEDLRKEYHRLEEDALRMKQEAQKGLQHKEALGNEYQRTIAEQRAIIEKKQRYIAKLEGKVRDLMYEIRSLLQLENTTEPSLIGSEMNEQEMLDYYLPSPKITMYDLSQQLKQYIGKAEELMGVDHLGYVGGESPRFLDNSLESYAVDRRRLFDSFKDETTGALFIYSFAEKKFLFVNAHIKTLIGWSPEKFIKDFPRLVARGYHDWEEALKKIQAVKECRFELAMLNKSGKSVPLECLIGLMSKGPFMRHVLGIVAPKTDPGCAYTKSSSF